MFVDVFSWLPELLLVSREGHIRFAGDKHGRGFDELVLKLFSVRTVLNHRLADLV